MQHTLRENFLKDENLICRGSAIGAYFISRDYIPDTLEEIGPFAFNNCHKLAKVNIPTRVKTIGALAFAACGSLTEVFVPASVTEFQEDFSGQIPFVGCDHLTIVCEPGSQADEFARENNIPVKYGNIDETSDGADKDQQLLDEAMAWYEHVINVREDVEGTAGELESELTQAKREWQKLKDCMINNADKLSVLKQHLNEHKLLNLSLEMDRKQLTDWKDELQKKESELSGLGVFRFGAKKSLNAAVQEVKRKIDHLELEISKLEGELASMTGPQNIKKQIADLEKESGNIQRKMVLLDTQMKGIQEKQRVNNLRITDLLRDGKRTEYYRVFKEHQKFEILDELMKEE